MSEVHSCIFHLLKIPGLFFPVQLLAKTQSLLIFLAARPLKMKRTPARCFCNNYRFLCRLSPSTDQIQALNARLCKQTLMTTKNNDKEIAWTHTLRRISCSHIQCRWLHSKQIVFSVQPRFLGGDNVDMRTRKNGPRHTRTHTHSSILYVLNVMMLLLVCSHYFCRHMGLILPF